MSLQFQKFGLFKKLVHTIFKIKFPSPEEVRKLCKSHDLYTIVPHILTFFMSLVNPTPKIFTPGVIWKFAAPPPPWEIGIWEFFRKISYRGKMDLEKFRVLPRTFKKTNINYEEKVKKYEGNMKKYGGNMEKICRNIMKEIR